MLPFSLQSPNFAQQIFVLLLVFLHHYFSCHYHKIDVLVSACGGCSTGNSAPGGVHWSAHGGAYGDAAQDWHGQHVRVCFMGFCFPTSLSLWTNFPWEIRVRESQLRHAYTIQPIARLLVLEFLQKFATQCVSAAVSSYMHSWRITSQAKSPTCKLSIQCHDHWSMLS